MGPTRAEMAGKRRQGLDTPIEQLRALIRLLLAAWADDEVGRPCGPSCRPPRTNRPPREAAPVVEGNLMGVAELGSDERDRLIAAGSCRHR